MKLYECDMQFKSTKPDGWLVGCVGGLTLIIKLLLAQQNYGAAGTGLGFAKLNLEPQSNGENDKSLNYLLSRSP